MMPPPAQADAERAGRPTRLAAHDRQCASPQGRAAIPSPGIARPADAGQHRAMPQLSTHLSIDAPADQVWDLIGPGFARIGEWATSIQASTAVPTMPVPAAATTAGAVSAPVAGRACATGVRLVPQVTETLVAYDPASRTLCYEASGLPAFIVTARNTWSVSPTGERTCHVTLSAHVQTRGLLGLLGRWALLAQVRYTSRHLEADLRHYIKHGTPSPRKQRQLSRTQYRRGAASARHMSRP